MNRFLLIAGMLLGICAVLRAVELPPGSVLESNGILKIGNVTLSLRAATSSWSVPGNAQWRNLKSEAGSDLRNFSGEFEFSGVQAHASETVRRTGPNKYRIEGEFKFASPVFANAVFADFDLPLPGVKLLVDGKAVIVPEVAGNPELFDHRQVCSIRVEMPGGTAFVVSGKLRPRIQDNRKYNGNSVSIRLACTRQAAPDGLLKAAKVAFELEILPSGALPVELGKVANGGVPDFPPPGELKFNGFPFRIHADGKMVAVGRGVSAEQVKLPLPANRARAVNLLHAVDWNLLAGWLPEKGRPVGFLDITYADGKCESIPVRNDVDCGNRTAPNNSCPNAALAITSAEGASPAGFYASSFALSGERPVAVAFRSAMPENVTWTVAAVTLSDRPIRFPARPSRPFTIKEGEQWKRLRFERNIIPGSPLDFSRISPLDAPAGKYGFVRSTSDGEFTFENAPDKRIRFYGVNLCFSANTPDRKDADELVEYLVRMGYNTVRFHHQESELIDKNAADSLTFDPVALDKLDYLFAKCKEHGIYLTTDLYVNRQFKPGDNIGVKNPQTLKNVKGLLAVNRAAMENWKEFVRRWMNHRNPYTGMTWGEDPALATLAMVNEASLASSWGGSPELIPIYRKKFEDWKKVKGLHAGDNASFSRFLAELELEMSSEMLDFVRNELKLKTMLTGFNCNYKLADRADYTDEHSYFAHPSFPVNPWNPPIQFDTSSPIRNNALLQRELMPRRCFGKPFTVSEFNYCYPNPFRAEQGPLIGAYAALQNWGGLWRFTWCHGAGGLKGINTLFPFDAVNDPMQQLSDRIVIALFLRGDMAPAREKITFPLPRDFAVRGSLPPESGEIGLNAQVGWHIDGEPLPDGARLFRPGMAVAPDSRLRLVPADGTFAVVTQRTETVTLPKGSLAAGVLRVKNADRFMTVAAISLDGKPLAGSGDILIIHLTNLSGSNVPYAANDICNSWGTWPLLVERGTAELELAGPAPWRVAALATDGSVLGEVPGEFKDGIFRFRADPGCFPGGVMAYHLTR